MTICRAWHVGSLQGMHGGDGDEDGERRMLEREAEQVEMEIRLLQDEMEQQTQHPHGTSLAQLPQAMSVCARVCACMHVCVRVCAHVCTACPACVCFSSQLALVLNNNIM